MLGSLGIVCPSVNFPVSDFSWPPQDQLEIELTALRETQQVVQPENKTLFSSALVLRGSLYPIRNQKTVKCRGSVKILANQVDPNGFLMLKGIENENRYILDVLALEADAQGVTICRTIAADAGIAYNGYTVRGLFIVDSVSLFIIDQQPLY